MQGFVNKRLVAVAPLCSILLCTSAQATSDKPRSIAACTAALEKKGIKANRLSAISTHGSGRRPLRKGHGNCKQCQKPRRELCLQDPRQRRVQPQDPPGGEETLTSS